LKQNERKRYPASYIQIWIPKKFNEQQKAMVEEKIYKKRYSPMEITESK